MTLVQSQVVSLSSSDLVKMDERKRPASHDHDSSEPPLKRQATTVNGTSKGHVDADMPWKDDLEVSQPCHSQNTSLLFVTFLPLQRLSALISFFQSPKSDMLLVR